MFFQMMMKSIRRRKRELRYVSAVTFIAVLFLTSVSVFQNTMDQYVTVTNYENYGEWILSSVEDPGSQDVTFRNLEHPYFSKTGICRTGPGILDADGEDSNLSIGTLDEALTDIGNISMYEGRMPEKDNEIAMDLPSLAALGYSYEVGQTVTVTTVIYPDAETPEAAGDEPAGDAGEEETLTEAVSAGDAASEEASAEDVPAEDAEMQAERITKDFVLTGTIKSFASNWAHDERYPLPNCIVTEGALDAMGGADYTTHFYQLDRRYEDINAEAFAASFVDEKSACTYNSYVYRSRVWGSEEMFTAVKAVLLVITALAVGYLLISYGAGRRKWYYQYRTVGAEKSQIRTMILLEGVYGVFPWALLAQIIPHPAAAGICLAVSKLRGLPLFYEFHAGEAFLQAGVIFGILLLTIVCMWLRSSDRVLVRNTQEVTEKQRKRLRRCGKGSPLKSFYKRQRKLYPLRQAVRTLFALSVCTVLIVTCNEIYSSVKRYQLVRDSSSDFSAAKRVDYSYEGLAYSNGEPVKSPEETTVADMYDGISAEGSAKLQSLIGISRLDMGIGDELHRLMWDGREDSEIVRDQNGPAGIGADELMEYFRFYENYEDAAEKLNFQAEGKAFDAEAFDRGEQIILTTGRYEIMWENGDILSGGERRFVRETGITEGQQLTIEGRESDGKISVTVGAVVEEPEEGSTELQDVFSYIPYGVIGSRALAERLAEADGRSGDLAANTVRVWLNSQASFEATEKSMAELFTDEGMDYYSSREDIVREWNNMINNLSIYGVFGCVILAVYLVLELNFNKSQSFSIRREYRLLRRMGLERRSFSRMTLVYKAKQAVWLLFAVPAAYGIMFAGSYYEALKEVEWSMSQGHMSSVWSTFLQEYTPEPGWMAAEYVLRDSYWGCTLAAVLLTAFILILGGRMMIRMLQEDEEEKQKRIKKHDGKSGRKLKLSA